MTQLSRVETIAGFQSDIMGNERDIFVYLPPGYGEEADRTYPVLYVHDGQNVFHEAFNGQSWNLHRVCDRLISEGRIEQLIVVAVSNMGLERSSEFAHQGPYAEELDYPCRGELYERFLTEEVKPHIDRAYRTKRESRHTALMGSSRGGLATYHIGFRRSNVFGKLAIVSPYFAQYDEESMTHLPIVQTFDEKGPLQIWIDTGGMEGMTVRVDHVRRMAEHFTKLGYRSGDDLVFCYEPMAEHNEAAWERRVHAPLIFFFGDKGAPVSAELTGDPIAGIAGTDAWVYPLVSYESGLVSVDLDASFRVTPEGAAAVDPAGLIRAAKAGECEIIYSGYALTASTTIRIVPELSEEVEVELEVIVPDDTPATARVYAGAELEKSGPRSYRRRLILPRNTGFAFHISEHSGLREAGPEGEDVPKRRFIADGSKTLRYEVQSWMQGQTI
ncbi:alpha/beta hydrolase [Paenibacillus pinisoli]|uniref:Alpha/beta hydrolase n=1 Tax=Paenibacillus pinisoli TaxID=1276110 RepID=A0A3A6PJ39_9BACL|nr:alpha/beta hydrolase-fold protein [Paenibacillus pinisoli]RJX39188.1 alpha/beta hydrolase [Paenibacillus pinisoli]